MKTTTDIKRMLVPGGPGGRWAPAALATGFMLAVVAGHPASAQEGDGGAGAAAGAPAAQQGQEQGFRSDARGTFGRRAPQPWEAFPWPLDQAARMQGMPAPGWGPPRQWEDPLGDWDPWFGYWEPPRPVRSAVTGRLVSITVVDGDGGEPHLAAGVWSRLHGYVPVDLGPLAHNRMTLQEGERVTVVGHLDVRDWSPMLAASRIRASGRRIELFRPGAVDTRITLDPAPPERVRPVEVEVAGLRSVWYTGFPSSHLVAHVWLDGRMTNVDLGPAEDLRGLNIRVGTELEVFARPGRINGRFALLAEEFRIGEEMVRVQQPA